MKKLIGVLLVLCVLGFVGYMYKSNTAAETQPMASQAAPVQQPVSQPVPAATQPVAMPVPQILQVPPEDAPDFLAINNSMQELAYLGDCLQRQEDVMKGYNTCVCEQNDTKAIGILQGWKRILAKHPQWLEPGVTLNLMKETEVSETTTQDSMNVQFQMRTLALNPTALTRILEATKACVTDPAEM